MKYYEDFQEDEITITRGRTITEADIVGFCMFSGDWYPLHSDREYAAKSPFGERIAHGLLVLSVASGLLPMEEWAIVAFYGMDRVRFTTPTKIGDTIHLEVRVINKKSRDETGGLIVFEMTVKNQRDEVAAISHMKIYIAKKPPETE